MYIYIYIYIYIYVCVCKHIYIYDISLPQALPPLPTPRGYLSATFSVDGRLYASGGAMSNEDEWACDAFEVYDTRAARWEVLAPLPTARANMAIALVVY